MNDLHAPFARALLDPAQPCPPGLRAWNGSDPAARFDVYRNNVMASLIDALTQTFPVSQELVGEEFFRAMAGVFIRRHPPNSPVLATYGEAFPGFVEGFAPAASVPYLGDVARVELLCVQAFHARDAEPIAVTTLRDALADVSSLPSLAIGLHPSLGVLRSRFAVASLWHAHHGTRDISRVLPDQAETALVLRDGLNVEVIEVPAAAGLFIERLQQGEALGPACEAAIALDSGFDLGATLACLIEKHSLTAIQATR